MLHVDDLHMTPIKRQVSMRIYHHRDAEIYYLPRRSFIHDVCSCWRKCLSWTRQRRHGPLSLSGAIPVPSPHQIRIFATTLVQVGTAMYYWFCPFGILQSPSTPTSVMSSGGRALSLCIVLLFSFLCAAPCALCTVQRSG